MTLLAPNAQRLLRALVTAGPAYRADLARSLDVSRATVTNLASALYAEGWIEHPDFEPGALKNLIGTSPRLGVLGSVLFLVDDCTVTLASLDGRLLANFTLIGSPEISASERMATGADLLVQMMAQNNLPLDSLRALHLAVDTQMDARSGDIYAQRASSRWFGVNPKELFENKLGVPVYVQNSARLEGLAENLWGAAQEYSDVLYVEASSGVASSHLVNGIIQSGARGGSGELGHTIYDWNGPLCTCGNSGCLMQYISIPALLRDHETATGVRANWDQFCELVSENDPTALALVKGAATILGRTLVNTCHLVDPEVIVIGGEVARSLPSFVEDVAATVRAHALPLVGRHVHVLASQLVDLHNATTRAGIESLRAIDAVVTSATSI